MNFKNSMCLLVLALSILVLSSTSFAGTINNWEFVYENDEYGNAVNGSIADLANAVKAGADVKIIVQVDNTTGSHAYTGNIAGATNNDSLVYMQHVVRSQYIDSNGTPRLIASEIGVSIYRTDGVRELNVYSTTGALLRTSEQNTRIKWYISK